MWIIELYWAGFHVGYVGDGWQAVDVNGVPTPFSCREEAQRLAAEFRLVEPRVVRLLLGDSTPNGTIRLAELQSRGRRRTCCECGRPADKEVVLEHPDGREEPVCKRCCRRLSEA